MPESLLLSNGRIRPLDSSAPPSDSIAVSDEGRIAAMGSRQECAAVLGRADREIDLGGRTVLPAFHDHLGSICREATARVYLDLSGLRGLPEIFGTIERVAKEIPKGEWIRGYGWSKGQWGWARFPHRADLDLVAPHHPVVLFSADCRVAWLNSQAITRLGINAQTPDPPGGMVERDSATRAATGILKETAVESILQDLPPLDCGSVCIQLPKVYGDYFRMGVVSVGTFEGTEETRTHLSIAKNHTTPMRKVCQTPFALAEELAEKGFQTGSRIGGVEIGGLRIHVDGTLASQTAWMREPYGEDWNEFGIQILSEDELRDRVDWCYRKGFAPILQVSGDAACDLALRVLSDLAKRQGELQPVLVNADLVDSGSLRRAAEIGIRIAANPYRIETESEVGRMFWGSRWERAMDLGGWVEAEVDLVFGSGESLPAWSPLRALKSAVLSPAKGATRRSLSLLDGLKSLTAPWRGHRTGIQPSGLRIGGLADLVILDGDPFEVAPDILDRIQVVSTLIGGQVVFE